MKATTKLCFSLWKNDWTQKCLRAARNLISQMRQNEISQIQNTNCSKVPLLKSNWTNKKRVKGCSKTRPKLMWMNSVATRTMGMSRSRISGTPSQESMFTMIRTEAGQGGSEGDHWRISPRILNSAPILWSAISTEGCSINQDYC